MGYLAASKRFNVSRSTLFDYVQSNSEPTTAVKSKLGRKPILPASLEEKLVDYVLIMERKYLDEPEMMVNKNAYSGKRKQRWEEQDIIPALAQRAISDKLYNHLRSQVGIPLPSVATLQRWTKKLPFSPGIVTPVLKILKEQGMSLSEMDKLSVLLFDEMNVNGVICYDHEDDSILGPHRNAQIVMIRGLTGCRLPHPTSAPVEDSGGVIITKQIFQDLVDISHESVNEIPEELNSLEMDIDDRIDTTELMKREEMEALRKCKLRVDNEYSVPVVTSQIYNPLDSPFKRCYEGTCESDSDRPSTDLAV
ncbi:hypothetical protein ANN_08795 [Periplaneta americana]|uniref:HTH psq-type domain-containing protein n=1 Tax=Periplaneta americana TaxID=6978 RepID=A0ABQ8T337_PERAM|nr:hypothetical protein ANN_08795 [Periplaneta americana]